jgi:hypothetical protein
MASLTMPCPKVRICHPAERNAASEFTEMKCPKCGVIFQHRNIHMTQLQIIEARSTTLRRYLD